MIAWCKINFRYFNLGRPFFNNTTQKASPIYSLMNLPRQFLLIINKDQALKFLMKRPLPPLVSPINLFSTERSRFYLIRQRFAPPPPVYHVTTNNLLLPESILIRLPCKQHFAFHQPLRYFEPIIQHCAHWLMQPGGILM